LINTLRQVKRLKPCAPTDGERAAQRKAKERRGEKVSEETEGKIERIGTADP
jgi:hypothetical protein